MKAVLYLAGMLSLSACSMSASLETTDLSQVPFRTAFMNKAVVAQPHGFTVENQYQVQATAGDLSDRIVSRTSSGYTVFTSTQGALFTSDTVKKVHDKNAIQATAY